MMSNEAIIAIIALIVGLPPTLLVLWHCIKKCMGWSGSSESPDVENGMLFDTAMRIWVDTLI